MTVIDAGTGDGARRPAPPILPFDVARLPRYSANLPSTEGFTADGLDGSREEPAIGRGEFPVSDSLSSDADDKLSASSIDANDTASESLAAIRHLRHIAELLHDNPEPAARWFIAKLAEYEGSISVGFTLDEILALTPHRGGRSWSEIETLQRRNRWLRIAAQRHFAGLSTTAQGYEIAESLAEFDSSDDWKMARSLAAPPAAFIGTAREAWFWIMKAGQVPAARTIRAILSAR